MKRFIDPCCDRCTHTKQQPCDRFIDCCVDGPLCHEDESCAEKRRAIIERLAHNPGYREH